MSPVISVIVPTYNRKQLLGELLESLYKQSISKSDYEVIVVSDGSKDGTSEFVRNMQKKHNNLIFIEQENQGPAAARNKGASIAKGTYLAYTDDDCVVSTDWLENIIQIFETKKIVGIQGKTTTYRDQRTPLTHQIDNPNGHPALPTCNAAFRKEAFDLVNGFDCSFPFAHNEDADLAWRMKKIGEISFEPNVHVIHPPRKDSFKKLAKRMRMLKSEFLLFYKDPESYKKYRSSSPWKTIYWEVFIKHQFRNLKSMLRYFFRPQYFFSGIALVFVWWINLVLLYPAYKEADNAYKIQFSRR
ncbi:glycosyltransferase [Candidatus Roizmanbacteria bacterium]|nr:glycosyltransferase [Candidatus Roizmanbacteria bacterium]